MAFSYAWLAADADKDGDSVVVLEPATDSFEVAGSGVAAASGIDPVTTGKVEPFDATDEMGELGRAIPKSGDELLFGSLVALRSGSDGSELVELGSAGAAEGKGVVAGGATGEAVNNPGLGVGTVPKIGVVGKVAVPATASNAGNGLAASGIAAAGAGEELKPALGAVLKAAHGSPVAAVVDGALLVAVNGPVTPEMSGVVVSRSTRFSNSGFNVVFVPLSATKPP